MSTHHWGTMGRAKYTPDEKKVIVAAFISAAKEIIDEEGVPAVSIRKVAARAGYSSATLYLYFSDVNELIMLASIGYLEGYCKDLAQKHLELKSPGECYMSSWESFCHHAFRHPYVFESLFFTKHATSLDDVVKRYYSIYPEQLENISGTVLSMLLSGEESERNMALLRPYAKELGLSEETTQRVNEITIAYFRYKLWEAREIVDAEGRDSERLKALAQDFLKGVRLITTGEGLPGKDVGGD